MNKKTSESDKTKFNIENNETIREEVSYFNQIPVRQYSTGFQSIYF
jgi:hypothetical protein